MIILVCFLLTTNMLLAFALVGSLARTHQIHEAAYEEIVYAYARLYLRCRALRYAWRQSVLDTTFPPADPWDVEKRIAYGARREFMERVEQLTGGLDVKA